MATLSGFLSINAFIDNANLQNSPIGEQSTFTKTFSNDPQVYFGSNIELSMYDLKDLTVGQQGNLDVVMAAVVAALNNMENLSDDINLTLEERVASLIEATADLTLVSIGPAVLHSPSSKNFPSSITFEYTAGGATGWTYNIWLSDSYFKDEYLPITYSVIPPIDNLNLFFQAFSAASTEATANKDVSVMMGRAETYLNGNVPTGYMPITLTVLNPSNTQQYVDATFLVAYNGYAGRTTEGAYEAILEYLVDNSGPSYDEQAWLGIIPALQPVETFYFVPMWGNKAVDSQVLSYPLLSPVIDLTPAYIEGVANTYFAPFVGAQTLAAVVAKMNFTVSLTKSAGMFIVADPDNQLGWNMFLEQFPDYMVIPSTDHNIGQISITTRNVINALVDLVIKAQTFTVGDTVNAPYSVETMGGFRYYTKQVGATVLRVLTRESYEASL